MVRKLVEGSWDPFSFDGSTGASLSADGLSVDLRLRDGGRGDTDGAADGRIVDPFAPGEATSLVITSDALPILPLNQPADVQLEVTGDEGTVTWTLLRGPLPAGLSLTSDGRILGTPVSFTASWVRVQADDGVTTTTKLLMVVAFPDPSATLPTAGLPLPDGDWVLMADPFGGFGYVRADGSQDPLASMSVGQAMVFSGASASVDRSLVLAYSQGPGGEFVFEVLDGVTGEPIELDQPIASGSYASFSPSGEWMAVQDFAAGSVRLVETTTWTTVRTVPTGVGMGCCLRWSAASDELLLGTQQVPGGTELPIVSPGDPPNDRTVLVADQFCGTVFEWSRSDRLALSCLGQLLTVSAVDGSDVRVVAQSHCPGDGSPCRSYDESGSQLRFSPSGSHILTTERLDGGPDPSMYRWVVFEDVDQATAMPLTEASQLPPMVLRWD